MHQPETSLEIARHHAAHQEAHIAQHRALIDRLSVARLPTDIAEEVLSTMEQRLAFYQGEIQRLAVEAAPPDRKSVG